VNQSGGRAPNNVRKLAVAFFVPGELNLRFQMVIDNFPALSSMPPDGRASRSSNVLEAG
jgi:hypothetical protein